MSRECEWHNGILVVCSSLLGAGQGVGLSSPSQPEQRMSPEFHPELVLPAALGLGCPAAPRAGAVLGMAGNTQNQAQEEQGRVGVWGTLLGTPPCPGRVRRVGQGQGVPLPPQGQ